MIDYTGIALMLVLAGILFWLYFTIGLRAAIMFLLAVCALGILKVTIEELFWNR